jgi:hypothetical protein
MRVQVNHKGLKLNGPHQLLVNANVNILGGSIHSIKKNTEGVVVAEEARAHPEL